MPPRPRVLVVYKKSAYQLYVRERRSKRVTRLLAERDPTVARLTDAHEDHIATVQRAREILRKLGADAWFRPRSNGEQLDADLVVTLGGDGTLLWASHAVGKNTPMLAINTAPRDSVGYFCAGDRSDMEEILARALSGSMSRVRLSRMRVALDGRVLTDRVLNDVLFCHSCPAETSRYLLRMDGIEEDQRSSGIWVGPAAGSTAAQRSAGGKVLPLGSRKLQFLVREAYVPPGRRYRLVKGLVPPDGALEIRSKMIEGRLYVDGPYRDHDIPLGTTLRLSLSPEPLTLLGLRRIAKKAARREPRGRPR